MYRVIAGIDVDSENPGYKHVYIKPQPGSGITSAMAKLESLYGEIEVAWIKKDKEMEIRIKIPEFKCNGSFTTSKS